MATVFLAACAQMWRSAVQPASHTLGFENLLEVTDWVHTLHGETSYSHYPVMAVMMNSLPNCSLGSCLVSGLPHTHTHTHTNTHMHRHTAGVWGGDFSGPLQAASSSLPEGAAACSVRRRLCRWLPCITVNAGARVPDSAGSTFILHLIWKYSLLSSVSASF